MEELQIYEEIVRLKKARRPAALATVVESQGSVPRKAGAKMLVREDGTTLGTIGGGPVEAAVIDRALAVDPFTPNNNVRKLTNHPGYRLRVGDWRVVYLVHEQDLLIAVVRIAPRGEVYQ